MKTKIVLLLPLVLLSWCLTAQIPSTYQKGTWKDFKTAALTYTFDDNLANQYSAAQPLFDNYGYKMTFFSVTQSFTPNWTSIKAAAAKGHEIGSHTVTHADLSTSSVSTQDTELKNSQATIQTQIPDKKCVSVAYPNCNIGDVATLQKYYIAGRICSGQVISNNPTDFYRLSSVVCGSQGDNTATAMNNRATSAKSSSGWMVYLMHEINSGSGYSPLQSSVLSSHLDFVNTNKADYWVGTFGDVVKYIKERNALAITETSVSADSLRLIPTDNLDNEIYTVGVTLRRQLPSTWTTVRVMQGTTLVSSSIVTVNNVKYIQFDVVPDKGVYTIANAAISNGGGGSTGVGTTTTCTEPGDGAYHTGVYKNPFKDVLGKTDAEIKTKVDAAFQHVFYGTTNQKLYYESGTDMAYILDVNNNDVRSEGMSYGLMICVQLDKKAEFDKLWKWTKTYMQHSSGNLDGYFKWQLNSNGTAIDNNPAPDGEAYFITSLLFAANRWGNGTGIYNYAAEAQAALTKIMNKTGAGGINNLFNANSKLITFGPNGGSYDFTDPSYNLPGFFELWAKWSTSNTSFWTQTPAAARKLIRDASHTTSGLSADYSNFDGTPKTTSFNSDSHRFMYDAWRTIMNMSMDYHWFKADAANQEAIATRYLTFFKNQGQTTYKNHANWDGSNISGDHSTGLVACNATAALVLGNTTLSQPFVNEFWNIALPTGTYRYYDGMLYMLGLLNCSGNFKIYKPACENACTTVAPTVTAAIAYEQGATASPLTATGTSLKWYTVATGGTALSSAPTPSTATVGVTSYYVSQTLGGCEGPRASITVTVTNTFKIFKITDPIVIDGTLEAVWTNGNVKSLNAAKLLSGAVSNTTDLSGYAKMLWDDNYVYVLAVVTDDAKYNDSQNSYDDDAVEFYFDVNNDKAETYGANDVQYAFGWNDGTIVGALPSGRSVTNITYAVVNTTDGYLIEARIPWSTLQGTPTANQLVGIDFMINDDDNGTGRDGKLSWNAATDDAWQNASLFGTGKLMDDQLVTANESVFETANFSIYPIPAKDLLHVSGLDTSFEYSIYDHTGRTIKSGLSENTIDISTVETGMYNLVLKSNGIQKAMKFVIAE